MQLVFFKRLLGPLYSLLEMVQNVMKNMLDSFDSLRSFISLVRSRVQQILMSIIQKIESLELGMRQFLIRLKSSIGKMEGVMITAEYTFIVISMALLFSSKRRHTSSGCTGVQTCALPICYLATI